MPPLSSFPKCDRAIKCLFAFISLLLAGSELVSSLAWCHHPRSRRSGGLTGYSCAPGWGTARHLVLLQNSVSWKDLMMWGTVNMRKVTMSSSVSMPFVLAPYQPIPYLWLENTLASLAEGWLLSACTFLLPVGLQDCGSVCNRSLIVLVPHRFIVYCVMSMCVHVLVF